MPTITQYENSIAYHSVTTATLEQLKNAKPYYELAIDYWRKENDPCQVAFFEDGLSFVNKRIEKLCQPHAT
jgi:hypothetical protein